MSSKYLKASLILSLAGTLFAGYLSAIKIFTKTCAFNEPCPYFLGYPACWYGFTMFFLMFIVSIAGMAKWITEKAAKTTILIISLIGIIFAGQYVIGDLEAMFNGAQYGMILPTCTYGLIFYIIIFIISIWKK